MLRTLTVAAALAAALPAAAQDEFDPWAWEEGSEARTWNLFAEHPAKFEARVVDIMCELSGDCPDDCGGGDRQLGLVRADDGHLVFPNKNSQPAFTGAIEELLPFCGQDVEVDGLLLDDPGLGARNVYLVQTIRALDGGDVVKANSWTKKWAAANPEAAGDGPWFRRDPRILEIIAEEGYFGLGLERDRAILDELYPDE